MKANPSWGSSFRLIASEKWKAKSAAMGRDVTDTLVDYAEPKPGMKILDLASGTGEPAITLASRIGSEGYVTALDLSSELLEIAAGRARERGLTNFATRQADAHALPFADESFDLVTSRFGVMFFQDCVRAFREVRRVLKPTARACFLAWGSSGQPYFASMVGTVVKHVGGPAIALGRPDPFRFAQPGSLSAVLKEAGFSNVQESAKTVPWTWPGTAEEVWEQMRTVATPCLPLFEKVPAGEWDAINREIYAAIEPYRHGDRIEFGAEVVLASGTK